VILAAVAFLGGVLVLLALPMLPTAAIFAVTAFLAALAAGWRRYRPLRIVAWACCGFLFAGWQAHRHLQLVWPEASADERVRVSAAIETIPVARGDGWLFDALIHIEAPRPAKDRLRVRVISRDPSVQPHAGEHWQLLLTLRPPRATLNPGGVDMERLLFHDRIHAMGTVVGSHLNRRIDSGGAPLTALRERIAQHIDRHVIDRDAAALIAALAVGATGAMSREQWRVFNATGTTHLVAISGMHVTMFALIVFALARGLWSAVVWRWVSWTRDSFAAATGLAAATAYAFLAGLSVPTQRTLIMLAAWLLARSMARASPPLQPLAIALIAVLLLDPFAPLAAGFWLSFGAMAAIIFVSEMRLTRRSRLHEAVAVQLAVCAVLVPLTFACFGSISVLGPLVNAAAIPYIGWVLVPVILLALTLLPFWPWAANHALALAEGLHNLAWSWLASAADSSFALAYASPPVWWYAVAACAIGIALIPWPWPLRVAAIVGVLPLTVASHSPPPRGSFELTALDAGEGSAVVIQTARHTLVYGTGESYGTQGSRVENIVVPFLRSRGVRAVDELMVNKLTTVTGSGVTALFAAMPVGQTRVGGKALPDFEGARACLAGDAWVWDDVAFRVRDSCTLAIQTSRGPLLVGEKSAQVQFTDLSGASWALAQGSRKRNGKERASFAGLREGGARVMATGDMGAIRVVVNSGREALTPEALRTARRAIWRFHP